MRPGAAPGGVCDQPSGHPGKGSSVCQAPVVLLLPPPVVGVGPRRSGVSREEGKGAGRRNGRNREAGGYKGRYSLQTKISTKFLPFLSILLTPFLYPLSNNCSHQETLYASLPTLSEEAALWGWEQGATLCLLLHQWSGGVGGVRVLAQTGRLGQWKTEVQEIKHTILYQETWHKELTCFYTPVPIWGPKVVGNLHWLATSPTP